MSYLSLRARALATASVAALALLGASATAAQANQFLTQTEACSPPLTGSLPATVKFDSAIPTTLPVKTPSGPMPVDISLDLPSIEGLGLIGAATVEGSVVITTKLTYPSGVSATLALAATIPKQDAASLIATGKISTSYPSIQLPGPGVARITVTKIELHLILRDSEGAVIYPGAVIDDPEPADDPEYSLQVACVPSPPGQDNTLAAITVLAAPGPLKPAVLALSPTHGPAAGGNEIVITGGFKTSPTTGVTFGGQPAELISQTSTTTTVKAPAGTAGATVDVVETNANGSSANTAADDYTYDSSGTSANYNYRLAGTATLKTLVKGSIPLTGSIKAKLLLPSGDFTADLLLNPATANLVALGFLPVTAKVQLVSTAPVTGSLVGGVLNADAKVRIKLPSVTLFGLQLGGGATCQTKSPSNIALKSTDAFFKPLVGGPLVGTFAISDLTGCGALNGILSPLTAGKGNAIALNLTPDNAVPPPVAN